MKLAPDRPRSLRLSAIVVMLACYASARAEPGDAPPRTAEGDAPPVQDRPASTAPKSATEARPLDLGDRVIRKAIVDSKDPMEGVPISHGAVFGSGGAKQQGVDRAFKEAEIPTCMTPEAFKFDQPQVGPFGLGGLLALPFLVHAIATGKCRH